MALNSSDVSAGDTALAAQYNSLIDDIEQHDHDGVDTAVLANNSVSGAIIANSGVGASKLADTATYENVQTGYYSVPHFAFKGRVTLDEEQRQGGDDGFLKNADAGFAARVFVASVHFDNGDIITSWTMHYARTEGVIDANLLRVTLAGGAETVMGDATGTDTGGSAHSVTDSTISNATIDNTTYGYSIEVTLNNVDNTNDVHLFGFSIQYTYTKP